MSYLTEQITAQKTLIDNITNAITALTVRGVVSYELDTGQNKTKVTRESVAGLIESRKSALNYLAELERAAGVSPSYVYMRPDF